MPLDPQLLQKQMPLVTRHEFTRWDTILYALGVGVGSEEPTDPACLRYLYEDDLQALPTMATILGYPGFWQAEPRFTLDWKRILHGEQSIEIHRPLPIEGVVRGKTSIEDILDKGPDKGAVLYVRRDIFEESSGLLLATVRQTSFLRGDGGFGGPRSNGRVPFVLPERECDAILESSTSISQALIYRLSGDYNPLHVLPDIARNAGYERPILHGLCTYGVVGRALLAHLCADEGARLKRMDVRFSSHLYPGETLRTEVWRLDAGKAAFRSTVVERERVALTNGYVEFE